MATPKALFFDYGLFLGIAMEFARHGIDTGYYSPWKGSMPTAEKAQIGEGIDGIDNEWQFFDAVRKRNKHEDVIIFPDVGDGDLITHLREDGYNVFGSGHSDIIEMNRLQLKEVLKKVGLPVIPFKHIIGIDALEKHLKTVNNKYIKTSYFRGLMETMHHDTWDHSKQRIDKLRHDAGAFQNKMDFIVEDPVEGIEWGTEWFCAKKGFLPMGAIGIENKNTCYLGKPISLYDLPAPFGEVHDNLEGWFVRHGLLGAFSTEVLVDENLTPWFNDATQRFGSPPDASLCNLWENLSDNMIAIAKGESPQLKANAKYVAQVFLKSEWAVQETTYLDFPEENLGRLFFRNLCKMDDRYLYVPQDKSDIVGSAVGLGNTIEEAEANAFKMAETVTADELTYAKDGFDKIHESIETAKSFGMGEF